MAGVGEFLASAALKKVGGMLGTATWEAIGSQLKLGDELKGLKNTVDTIQNSMVRSEKRLMVDGDVRNWMRQLKLAAYDMEDMIMEVEGDILCKDGSQSQINNSTTEISIPVNLRLTMPSKLKAMKQRLEDIEKLRRFDLMVDTNSDDQDVIQTRATGPCLVEGIVGRDKDKLELMKLLQDCEHRIIPIYGFGGLGKTTLAQMVFDDNTTKTDFDIQIWVYVSTKFSVENIGRSIISQVDGHSNQHDLPSVQKRVKMILSGKKYLIVLDDLWEENTSKLQNLEAMLKGDGPGSKIIVTTPKEQVAKRMNRKLPFKLGPLPYDDCWELFKAKAFPNGIIEESEKEKKDMGEKIVKKCGGVPLAVKSLGDRLLDMPMHRWEETLKSDLWEEERDPTAATTSTAVLPSLKISYYHMPYYLRPCFVYFSAFPKGFVAEKRDLIHRWISLGFVSTTHRAEEYLQELCQMSFLEATSASTSISARYSKPNNPHSALFKMHDLVHELARSVAVEEVAICDANHGSSGPKKDDCRYMLLSNFKGQYPKCKDVPLKARAVHFNDCTGCQPSKDAFSKAKWLRVLDFSSMQTVELPRSMGNLRHLQVLNLSENTSLEKLQSSTSICDFQKLHYLDLHGCSNLRELPDPIHRLQDLVHLDLSGCTSLQKLPSRFGELQKLSFMNLSCCSQIKMLPDSFSQLENLEHLDLSGCTNLQKLPSRFGELQKLSFLNLSCCSHLEMLPHSFSLLENLEHLNMSSCCQFKQLCTLSLKRMKGLRYLNMSGCIYLETLPEFCSNDDGCLNLEILDLSDCAQLTNLGESCARLHKLRFLNLSGCSRIQNIILFLGKFVKLEYLNLSGVALSGFDVRKDSEAPSSSTGHSSDYSGEQLSLKMMHDIVKNMYRLEYLSVGGVSLFSKEGISNDLLTLPDFVVSARGRGDCSNITLLQNFLDSTHRELNIRCLEVVKSAEEAERVELRTRHRLGSLSLEWSSSEWYTPSEPTVKTMSVLENLKPHPALKHLSIKGYNHSKFPSWIMKISVTLPNLVKLVLSDLVCCDQLPTLGNLSNLEELEICNMPKLKKTCLAQCKNLKRLSLKDLAWGCTLLFSQDGWPSRTNRSCEEIHDMELDLAEEFNRLEVSRTQSGDPSRVKGKANWTVMKRKTTETILRMIKWRQLMTDVPESSSAACPAKEKKAFPPLCYLKIEYCPNLHLYPCIPNSEEYFINESGLSMIDDTLSSTPILTRKMHIQSCSNDTPGLILSVDFNIGELVIDNRYDMMEFHLPTIYREKKFENQTIQKLKILNCENFDLQNLPGIQSVQELEIVDCLEKTYCFDELGCMDHLAKLTLSSPKNFMHIEKPKILKAIPHIQCIKTNEAMYFAVQESNFVLFRQNTDFGIRDLFISNLERVNNADEVSLGELARYEQLHTLSLVWSDDANSNSSQGLSGADERPSDVLHPNLSQNFFRADDSAVLQRLLHPHHPNLSILQIEGYGGAKFCESLGSSANICLPNIVKIELASMPRCECLPSLGQLANLEELHISYMPNLREVDASFYGGRDPFRKLRKLCINKVENLEVWSMNLEPSAGQMASDDGQQLQRDQMFPCLIHLTVTGCPRLAPGSGFLEYIRQMIGSCSIVNLSPGIFVGSSGLSRLELEQNIFGFSDASEFLQYITDLSNLTIKSCSDLITLPQIILNYHSLRSLRILDCWNFSVLPDWLGDLSSLENLEVHAPKLQCLPHSIKDLTSLKILTLKKCNYKLREWCSRSAEVDVDEGPDFFISSGDITILQKLTSSLLIELNIKDLECLATSEVKKINLVGKDELDSLSLEWKYFDWFVQDITSERSELDKDVLQELQPHQNLKRLFIRNYVGAGFPNWMHSLENLVSMELSNVQAGQLHLDHLQNLEDLHISSFSLEGRSISEYGANYLISRSSLLLISTKQLKKLKRVTIARVGNCVWQTSASLCMEQEDNKSLCQGHMEYSESSCQPAENIFPGLECLEIDFCLEVRFDPAIPRSTRYKISGNKYIPWVFKWPSFEQVMAPSTSASSSKMEIKYIENLSSGPWDSLGQLDVEELTVDSCGDFSPLPECIRSWKNLAKLEILNCEDIKTLPEWLGDMASLRELKVETYWMKTLPPCIERLTSLHTLALLKCTKRFKQRCSEAGDDWSKIKHIENLQIEEKKP